MPCFNPPDIVDCLYEWIDAHENGKNYKLPKLKPYWEGFKGTITKDPEHDSRYHSNGIWEMDAKGKVTITELPIGVWTDKYKDFLETLVEERKIKNLKNYSTVTEVHFEFMPTNEFHPNLTNLKLVSVINLTNMVLFGKDHKLQKFTSISQIFTTFCKERYVFYEKRKKYCEEQLKRQIKILQNKARFLDTILTGKLELHKIQDKDIVAYLESHEFDKLGENDYGYLLNIPIRQMTKSKLQELQEHMDTNKQLLKKLSNTTLGQLWKADLNEFKDLVFKGNDEKR
jgi:DNA topoisomerase-2